MSTPQTAITNVLYPPGRYVGGDIYEIKQKTDQQKQPRFYAPGHKKAGEPMLECYFGLAIPKAPNQTDAALAAMGLPGFKQGWAIKPTGWDQQYPGVPYWGEVIWQEAHKSFPKLINPTTQRIELPTFAWKIEDGDDTTPKGESQIPNCKREGHPGCWIVSLKSGGVPKIYDQDGKPLLGEGIIKRGWWIEVYGSTQGNGQLQKPGVYLNHSMVSYRAPDKEIVFGPDPTKVGFGKFALPAGVSAQPLGAATNFPSTGVGLPSSAPGGNPLPGGLSAGGVVNPGALGNMAAGVPAGLPGGLPQGALPGQLGVPGAALAQAPTNVPVGLPGALPAQTSPSSPIQTAVQPHPGFLQPQVGLAPAGAPIAPVVPAQPVLAPGLAAQGVTWAVMVQNGWTVEAARAAGHVVG
jgi:hypothetical protein